MNRVVTAIENGRCVLAVSSSLLRDESVLLALREREALPALALSGPVQAPALQISEGNLLRATAQPDGVVVIVEPAGADDAGMRQIAEILQRAAHKPTVLVLGRVNPLMIGMLFRGLTVDTLKGKTKTFFKGLPMPPAVEDAPVPDAPAAVKGKSSSDSENVRFVFAGREEEVASLTELLGEGGPIVVSGAHGVGRTQIVEHAIANTELSRLPDFRIGRGSGFDTLIARIAEIGKAAGNASLADLLGKEHTPLQLIDAAVEVLGAVDANQVMVIHRLELAIGREGDAFRKGRLELLVQALLRGTYGMRIVFTSVVQPVFYREGAAPSLRRVEVGGIKGRFLHEIFDAYRAPEFPREKFGPMNEKIHGHPVAARTYAVAVREKGLQLVEDAKFMKMGSLDDVAPVEKAIGKTLEKLSKDLRGRLSALAHLRYPVDGSFLSDMGISRKHRMALLKAGVLDVVGTMEEKRYRIHRLVGMNLSFREISDFDTHKELGQRYSRLSRNAEGLERLWTSQEANRQFVSARAMRDCITVPYPDNDALVDSTIGMLRAQNPRFDIAERRLREVLKTDAANSEAWIQLLDVAMSSRQDHDAIVAIIDEAIAKAPVPELFHQAVRFYLMRRKRNKAIAVLEAGVAAMPDESRLKCRLASMLLREGRRSQAIELLEAAMSDDPMLPDAYGLLGNARRDEGLEALDKAEELLREAVRLAPEDSVQLSRLAHLLFDRATAETEGGAERLAEAKELLDTALKIDKKSAEVHLLLARIVRHQGADFERATWLLDKAWKLTDRNAERKSRIRLERALVDMHKGELDKAESEIRGLLAKDPSNARIYMGLATVLEAKQLFIPAHAEYTRAKERCNEKSLTYREVEGHLARLQALIEAQAAGLAVESAAPAEESTVGVAKSHARVIRRRGGEQTEVADPAVVAANEAAAAVSEVEAAPAEADVAEVEAAPAEVDAAEAEVEVAPVVDAEEQPAAE
ncbi:MAG: tetratricopeptide repeat protein [Deltaproteobacteria bacterium]|nr:MAG: tetratricopeptide repeat protein [Deltaproteobacteria bacterium]